MNFFDQTNKMLDIKSAMRTALFIITALAFGAIGAVISYIWR